MFSGSFVAIVTPMRCTGEIDWAAWERLIDFHLTGGTTGVVIGGTTGESPALTEGELLHLIEQADAQCRGRMQLIAGAGAQSTAATIERIQRLSDSPLQGLLVVTPAYNKPTQEGLFRHFEAAAHAAQLPLILYNVPGRTAVDLLPGTVERLARIPGIVGIKEAVAGAERVRQLKAVTPGSFVVLSGDDATALDACAAGGAGVISVTANIAPRQVAEVMRLAGDRTGSATALPRARQVDAPLAALHANLFVESNPIPVKYALARMGLIENVLRLPLTPLSLSYESSVDEAMRQAGIRL